MKYRVLDRLIGSIPLNSWFWISFLYFGQGICAILFARAVKIPADSVFFPILVLFAGGLASVFFYRSGASGMGQWQCSIAALLYALFIFLMSSRSYPGARVPFDASYFHPLEYLTLGLLLGRLWYSVIETRGFWSFAARVVLAGAIFGASDELHQYFIPGRDCDIRDFFLDLCGIAFSLVIIVSIRQVISEVKRVKAEDRGRKADRHAS
jgi:VanZ family protein